MKKLIKVIIIAILIVSGISFIRVGIYFRNISKPKYIYSKTINSIFIKLDEFKQDKKYNIGDNFKVTGNIDFDLSSEKYNKESITNLESKKKNNLINNLSKMNINYNIIQDEKTKKMYISLKESLGSENLINYNYFIENSTQYYYIDKVINNYINDGSNNYFEIFESDETTISNKEYMINYIKKSLAEELEKETIKKTNKVIINKNTEEANVLSLKLDNSSLNEIINNIVKDIKKDKKAYKIMHSINNDFGKRKVKRNYLEKNESYTINIYCSKYLYKPLKYEFIHLKNNKINSYSYEGNLNEGELSYYENNKLKYISNIIMTKKEIKMDFYNSNNKSIGNIKLNKDQNNILLIISIEFENSNYDITYSKKYKNYKKNKSYEIETNTMLNIFENNESVINGEIKMRNIIDNDTNIDIDVSKSILMSQLNDEQKNKYNILYDSIKERLENE